MESGSTQSKFITEGIPVEKTKSSLTSNSSSSSSDGTDDPAQIPPLAQSFPSSSSSEDEGRARDNTERPRKKSSFGKGLGLFLRGYDTHQSKARKRRRFGSLEPPKEPVHVRRQKREYYDSDNSYEALEASEYNKIKVETVDYCEIAAGPSCDELIFSKLTQDEVSELIGYATDARAQASVSAAVRCASLPTPMQGQSQATSSNMTEGQALPLYSTSATVQSYGGNPLLGLPSTPLPTSYLRYISKMAAQAPEFIDKLENRFNDSALVATGMLIEEMITASLMPLAGYHVMRCRELEARAEQAAVAEDSHGDASSKIDRRSLIHPVTGKVMLSDKMLVNPQEKSSAEWTLPPDEALMKLLEQDAIPPEGLYLTPPATQTLHDRKRKVPDKDWEAVQLFSKDNKMATKEAIENMDIYRLFLQMANYNTNASPTMETESTDSENSDGSE